MVSNEPIKDITRPALQKRGNVREVSEKEDSRHGGRCKKKLPKKGMLRPTNNVDTTNAVRMRMEYMYDFAWLDGISSSRHIATGDMVNAYVFIVKEQMIETH